MESIVIRGLDGPRYNGTVWTVSEGQTDLALYETRKEAERQARNEWALPGQEIKVVSTTGKVETLRAEDRSKQRQRGGGHGGPFGGGLF